MNKADLASKLYYDNEYHKCLDMVHPQQTCVEVLYYAALSLEALNRKPEAVEMLRRALSYDHKNEKVLRELAWNLTDDIECLGILERLAKTDKADNNDYCLMGELYNRCNRLNESHHWYQVALDKESHNAIALAGIAEIHVKLAIRYLQEAEDEESIDLSNQISEEWDAEEALRFIYDNIIKKKNGSFNEKQYPNLP